jgi:mannan endo-1,4-beta-mannosidase
MKGVICLCIILTAASAAELPGLQVRGRYLYDRCGERIILRGVNAMILYWDRAGTVTYPEIAKTGANCTRIFWRTGDGTPGELDQTISNCIAQDMISMPCVWEATGEWDQLQTCVNFWTSDAIAEVIRKHEEYLILNIANEAGDGSVSQEAYRNEYADAIQRLRSAGIHVPLVIDAANWGRGEHYILENGQYLLGRDPDSNLIFSWHPWDTNQPQNRIKEAIDGSIDEDLCMIIGEFSHIGVFYSEPIHWEYIMEYSQEKEIGWLPWVWWCCQNPPDGHTISSDKMYGSWTNDPWGEQVAVANPYSIQNTSVRPYYVENGECDETAVIDTPIPLEENGLDQDNTIPSITYQKGKYILVNVPDDERYAIELFDSKGKLLMQRKYSRAGTYRISEKYVSEGLYHMKVRTGNRSVIRRLIF